MPKPKLPQSVKIDVPKTTPIECNEDDIQFLTNCITLSKSEFRGKSLKLVDVWMEKLDYARREIMS